MSKKLHDAPTPYLSINIKKKLKSRNNSISQGPRSEIYRLNYEFKL